MPSIEIALRDFARVTKVGGEVRCTLPLAGTFQEFHDLYREVLIKHDKHEALDRLDRHIARYPTIDHVERCLKSANLDGEIEAEEFTLLFKSSREFFFAPVIEYGPLAEWKDIAGAGQEMQDVFWYIKEAIDAYFDGRPFHVTVKAGCLRGKKVDGPLAEPEEIDLELELDGPPVIDMEEQDTDLPRRPLKIAAGSVRVDEISEEDLIDEGSQAEAELDAFTEGKQRPSHLDED
jgi:hypothetical protein